MFAWFYHWELEITENCNALSCGIGGCEGLELQAIFLHNIKKIYYFYKINFIHFFYIQIMDIFIHSIVKTKLKPMVSRGRKTFSHSFLRDM